MVEWLAVHPILHGIGIGFGAGVSLVCLVNAVFWGRRRRPKLTQDEIRKRALQSALMQPYKR